MPSRAIEILAVVMPFSAFNFMFRFKELYLAAESLVQPFYAAVMPFTACNLCSIFLELYPIYHIFVVCIKKSFT